mgnify:CR=1 FL=1
MASVNKHIILGRLGQDPEVRFTQSGTAVCNLSIATDGFGQNAETEWHEVVVWGKAAEQCGQYLSKGREVYVEGEARTDKWTDRDGNERKTKKVHTNFVQFIGGGGDRRGDDNRDQNRNNSRQHGGGGDSRNNGGGQQSGGNGGGWGNQGGGNPSGNGSGGWGKSRSSGGGGWGKQKGQPEGGGQGNGGSGGRPDDGKDPIPF